MTRPALPFADAIALVRRHLWVQQGTFMPSEREHESIKVPRLLYRRMLDTLAYAASLYKAEPTGNSG